MPAYVRFTQDGVPVRGSVRSGIHMGWIELAAFDVAPPRGVWPPTMWMLTRTTFPIAGRLSRSGGGRRHTAFEPRFTGGVKVDSGLGDGSVRMLAGRLGSSPTGTAAEVDLTTMSGGCELIVLRALVHGVRLVGHAPCARAANDLVMEEMTFAHEGITRAGAPLSSGDITSQVRGSARSQLFRYSLDLTVDRQAAPDRAYLRRRPGSKAAYDYPGDYAQRFDGIDK